MLSFDAFKKNKKVDVVLNQPRGPLQERPLQSLLTDYLYWTIFLHYIYTENMHLSGNVKKFVIILLFIEVRYWQEYTVV